MMEPLTRKEKEHIKKFVQKADKMKTWSSNEWAAGAVLLLGGFLTVYVLFTTQANLSATVISKVLIPGTTIGLVLMLAGGLGMHLSKKSRELQALAGILKKLTAQESPRTS